METKLCTKCQKQIPLDGFYFRRRGKPDSWCKKCHCKDSNSYLKKNPKRRAYVKKWLLKHPNYEVEARKKYVQRHPERVAAQLKAWSVKKISLEPTYFRSKNYKNYGISLDDYNVMLSSQGGVCAICSGFNEDGKALAVDHCHRTGKVRALLCRMCNLAIGNFKENTETMLLAIEYLKKHHDEIPA